MLSKNVKLFLVFAFSLALFVLYLKAYFNFNHEFNFHRTVLIKNNYNKLKVDQRSEPNKFIIQERISENIPYLPIEELQSPINILRNYNFTCAWHPDIMNVYIQNEYWQIFYNPNITYYIFGAYLDTRPLATENKTVVRILAMIDIILENDKHYPVAYCQMWFRERFAPVIVPVVSTKSIWVYQWGHSPQHNYPHIISCELPKPYEKWRPKSISLVAAPCDQATNNLRVVYNPLKSLKEKQDFAVCIKGLDFPYIDMSYRFVEYIEAIRVFGVQKLIVYNLEIHENISKVFNYYEAKGFLEQRKFGFTMKYSNLPEYRHLQKITDDSDFILHESIALNDCFYRNMYQFKHVGVWDFDELPIPLGKYYSYHDLVKLAENCQTQKCKSYASFCFSCAYFPKYEGNFTFSKKYPDYLYMLQHVLRVKEHTRYGFATKCLHHSDRIIATHNHFPRHYKADCRDYTFHSSDAQMNHYREPDYKENYTNPVIDKGLQRYGRKIMENSLKVFKDMDFFEKF